MELKPLERIKGIIVRFTGNGRKLGYPTANINSQSTLSDGVYFGTANMGKYIDHPALIFIGTPTTVGDTERRVEAHLLDIPDQDYYGLDLGLNVLFMRRPNEKFSSLKELTEAMQADDTAARLWFKGNNIK